MTQPSEPRTVTLVCSDTSNIWGNVNGWMMQFRGVSLVLTVVDLPEHPVLRFVPLSAKGANQRGMKIEGSPEERAVWSGLTSRVSRDSPRRYRVAFRYDPKQ